MIKNKSETKLKLSWQKKAIFAFVTISILFMILSVLEIGLRLGDYGEDLRLFVSTPTDSSQHYGINLNVAQRYFYYYGDAFDPTPRKDLFLKKKPENGFRIFVLGASTTAGFPYGNNISFPRFLHQRLVDAFPNRYVEVVNTAITSVNTYTLLDFMDEILEQEPDLILIYAGHNEFFGPFGPVSGISFGKYPWVVKSILSLQRYRSFILLRNILGPAIRSWTKQISIDPGPGVSQNITEEFIQNTTVNYESKLFRHGLEQYESNIKDILDKAGDAKVPVILSELICNIRDQAPFPANQTAANSEAVKTYAKARQLEKQNKFDEARELFYKAKDLDPVRFRAPEEYNKIIHKLSKEFDIPVVPMKSCFEKISPHGLIGNNIILEHVHPDVGGYFLMADAFYNTMKENKLIEKKWPEIHPRIVASYLHNWGITKLDTLAARLVTLNLTSGWPFTTESFSTKLAKQQVIEKFTVETVVDSFALATYVNPNYSVQSAHYDLAQFYERTGEIRPAIEEYKALIYSIPTMEMFYKEAARLLILNDEYDEAYQLLKNAQRYNQSADLYRLTGQVCLRMNHIKDGIGYLNSAYELNKHDKQSMEYMIRGYYMGAAFENGDALLRKYSKIASSSDIIALKEYRDQIKRKMIQASEYFESAKNSFYSESYQDAIKALHKSVEIHETSLANELMGVIMLRNSRFGSAITYLERARQLSVEENPSLLYNLCMAYMHSKQPANALVVFSQIRQLYPQFKGLEKLEQQLREYNPKIFSAN